jgi:hypothetical protein
MCVMRCQSIESDNWAATAFATSCQGSFPADFAEFRDPGLGGGLCWMRVFDPAFGLATGRT